MDTVTAGRRRGKASKPAAESIGERFARYLREEEEWQRFLRHHTAIGEKVADVQAVAEKAVGGLTEYTSPADREALILRALACWRAMRRPPLPINPYRWEVSDRWAFLTEPCINGA